MRFEVIRIIKIFLILNQLYNNNQNYLILNKIPCINENSLGTYYLITYSDLVLP